jgi:hypothetical protein
VPAGWTVLTSNVDVLVLGPTGSKPDSGPGVDFIGKIAVMQEGAASFPSGIPMDKVKVAGGPGVIAHMKGSDGARTLFVKQSSADYLAIQVWGGLGWSNAQIVQFGAGVHVTKAATVGQG